MKKRLPKVSLVLISSVLISSPVYALENTSLQNQSPSILQKAKTALKDTSLTTTIKAKFLKSNLLNPFKVGVETDAGRVYLSGTVDTTMQYEEAVILADSTEGVKEVNVKHLHVKESKQPLKDTYITAKVKGTLLKEKIMGDDIQYWPIQIETQEGVVYLKGVVKTERQKHTITTIAKSIDGMVSVKDAIRVASEHTN